MMPRLPVVALVMVALSSTSASAQQLGGAGTPDLSIVRFLAALFLCFAAALGMALFLRSRQGRQAMPKGLRLATLLRGSGRIEVLESRRVSPHADLCLLRCDDIEYVLLCSPTSAQVLSSKTVKPQAAASDGAA